MKSSAIASFRYRWLKVSARHGRTLEEPLLLKIPGAFLSVTDRDGLYSDIFQYNSADSVEAIKYHRILDVARPGKPGGAQPDALTVLHPSRH